MAIRFVKVRSFSNKRRAHDEAEKAATYSEVMAHRSPLSDEYRRTMKPGTMMKPYAEKQKAAKRARKGRKVQIRGEKIHVRT